MMAAYECRRCPDLPFAYTPGICGGCDLPLFPLGGVA